MCLHLGLYEHMYNSDTSANYPEFALGNRDIKVQLFLRANN